MDNRNERVVVSHAGLAPWSLLFADGRGAAPELAQSVGGLCQRHAAAIYAYLRRRGLAPEAAHQRLHDFVGGQTTPATPAASFRLWLPVAIDAFLAGPAPPPATSAVVLPTPSELEEDFAYAASVDPAANADLAFAADFARGMLALARQRLQQEATQAGRAGWYEQLAPWLAVEPREDQLAQLAASHHVPARILATALKRLRQRFRELVDAELAATVTDAAALEGERMALYAALAGAPR